LSAEVINARFVKPLDEQLILSVFQRGLPVLVVEDNTIVGGFGSAILELASTKGCPVNSILRLGVPDAFVDHDSPESLYQALGLSAERIAEAAKNIPLITPGIRGHSVVR
jgi:1-deoxy-D-xylulose-5-phosphate synthase